MKCIIFSFCVLLNFVSHSQDIIIDNSATTAAIFNYNDPFSLLSLLYNNQIRAIDMDAEGIEEKTLNKIRKGKWDQTIEKFWSEKDLVPLEDAYGEAIFNPEKGTYVWQSADTIYYDLTNISRLIVSKDTVLNKVTGEKYIGIDRLRFFKQYELNKELYEVFSCSYNLLVELDGFKAWFEVKGEHSLEYLNALYWLQNLEELCKGMHASYNEKSHSNILPKSIGVSFFQSYNVQPYFWDNRTLYKGGIDGLKPYPREINHQYMVSAQSVESAKKALPFTCIKHDSLKGTAALNALFEDTKMEIYSSDIPLVDDYGDPIVIIRENGVQEFQYMPLEPIYFWVPIKKLQIFKQLDFRKHDPFVYGQNSLNVEKIIYATKLSGYDKPVSVIEYNCYDDKRERSQKKWSGPNYTADYYLNFSDLPCFKMLRELTK